MSLKLAFKAGIEIIQTEKEINFPTSRPLIKKLLLKIILNFTEELKIDFLAAKQQLLQTLIRLNDSLTDGPLAFWAER